MRTLDYNDRIERWYAVFIVKHNLWFVITKEVFNIRSSTRLDFEFLICYNIVCCYDIKNILYYCTLADIIIYN